ncbi:MAG: FHA domain-containing protein [Anaerolineales bacterium]|nr:FHA domain-containing protein [Anaerolineales bacterium]
MPDKLTNLAILSILLLLLPFTQAPAGEASIFLITNVNTESFPDVQLNLRILDENGKAVNDISNLDLSLYEDDLPITDFDVNEYYDGPINLIFVVDLGQDSNYTGFGLEHVRRAMTHSVIGGHFHDGRDTVVLLGRVSDGQLAQTIVLFGPSQDGGEFIDFVNSMSLNPSDGPSQGLQGVEDALGEMVDMDSLGEASTSIIFITHVIDTLPDAQATAFAERIANTAREKLIPVYTFQTRIGGDDSESLVTLAQETGGAYLRLLRDEDQRAELDLTYEEIASQRTYYALTYRSSNGSSEVRKIAIGPAGISAEGTTTIALFGVDLLPPTLEIESPEDDSMITVELTTDSDGVTSYSPDTLTITANLTEWPDGYPRYVQQAKLIAGGDVTSSVETEPDDTQFTFTWNIEDLDSEGVTTTSFKVRVVDELGIEAESEPVSVHFEPLIIEENFLEACLADPLTPPCMAAFLLPPLLLLTVAAAAVVALFIVLRSRSARVAPATPTTEDVPRHTVMAPVREVEDRGEVLAKLKVLEGPISMRGVDLMIRDYTTILGRDPGKSNISFYHEGDTSISGRHCTLQLYSGKFYLIDNHSMNGTLVNGTLIEPGQPYPLGDGDEIELGDLAVRGVKLKFTATEASKKHAGLDGTLYEEEDTGQ